MQFRVIDDGMRLALRVVRGCITADLGKVAGSRGELGYARDWNRVKDGCSGANPAGFSSGAFSARVRRTRDGGRPKKTLFFSTVPWLKSRLLSG